MKNTNRDRNVRTKPKPSNHVAEPLRVSKTTINSTPQHPLITKYQWERLKCGEIKKFSYRPKIGQILGHSITLTKEDAP